MGRINEVQEFTEKSDVYSFGVFLLELVSGQAAAEFQFIGPHESIIKWVNISCQSWQHRWNRSFSDI